MNWQLSKRLRQVLAVSLLAATLATLMVFVVLPIYGQFTALTTQIDQERLVLGHLSLPRSDENQRHNIERIASPEQLERLVLPGESDTIRLANLQSTLGALAANAGVQLRSTRNLSPVDRPEARLLGVQLQFAATIEQLQTILIAIEAQRPQLRVEALQITVLQDTVAAGSSAPPSLEARLDVMGATPRQKG
jgi:Type II secretion system (T2SS), protein M subtype b